MGGMCRADHQKPETGSGVFWGGAAEVCPFQSARVSIVLVQPDPVM